MAKSNYETFTDIASAVMKSGYGQDFVQRKRIYDMDNKSRYVEVYDEEATIARLCLTMERGAEIGIMPLQSLYSIVWYAGRPCIYGDMALAMCQSRPDWGGIEEEPNFDCERQDWEHTTIIWRNGTKYTAKFTWKDAVDAGLSRLPHYREYGKRMLAVRSRTWALRAAFADVLSGISIAEEMKDFDMVNQLKASEKKVSETVSASAAMDKFTQAAIAEKGDVKPDLDKAMSHKFVHDEDPSGITFNESVIEKDLELKIAATKPGEAIEVTEEESKIIKKRGNRKKAIENK